MFKSNIWRARPRRVEELRLPQNTLREKARRVPRESQPPPCSKSYVGELRSAVSRNPQFPPSIQLEAPNTPSTAIVSFHHADRNQETEAGNDPQERVFLSSQPSRDRCL